MKTFCWLSAVETKKMAACGVAFQPEVEGQTSFQPPACRLRRVACVSTELLFVLLPDENLSVCWQHVSADLLCQSPLLGAQVTFIDCCCFYGEGWGMGCALCPRTDSGKRRAAAAAGGLRHANGHLSVCRGIRLSVQLLLCGGVPRKLPRLRQTRNRAGARRYDKMMTSSGCAASASSWLVVPSDSSSKPGWMWRRSICSDYLTHCKPSQHEDSFNKYLETFVIIVSPAELKLLS